MTQPIGMRKDMFEVTLTVNGRNLGVWDALSGGKAGSTSFKTKSGGMGPEKSLGGTTTIEPLTLSRNYELERDHAQSVQFLLNGRGKARCIVAQQPLDPDGNAFGRPIVKQGTLTSVDTPEHDANATDAALITLEIECDGEVTAI